MEEISYRTLVWLSYRLSASIAIGTPLILIIWAAWRQQGAILRLLTIYWKVASLMAINSLLLTGEKSIGYLIAFAIPILLVTSVWFWIDLNEELKDLPYWRPLPLTVRVWRWALTGLGIFSAFLSYLSLSCMQIAEGKTCSVWLEIPQSLHITTKQIFQFLFGANWNEALAGFIGYLLLIIYVVSLIQFLLDRLPKYGRIAGNF